MGCCIASFCGLIPPSTSVKRIVLPLCFLGISLKGGSFLFRGGSFFFFFLLKSVKPTHGWLSKLGLVKWVGYIDEHKLLVRIQSQKIIVKIPCRCFRLSPQVECVYPNKVFFFYFCIYPFSSERETRKVWSFFVFMVTTFGCCWLETPLVEK